MRDIDIKVKELECLDLASVEMRQVDLGKATDTFIVEWLILYHLQAELQEDDKLFIKTNATKKFEITRLCLGRVWHGKCLLESMKEDEEEEHHTIFCRRVDDIPLFTQGNKLFKSYENLSTVRRLEDSPGESVVNNLFDGCVLTL